MSTTSGPPPPFRKGSLRRALNAACSARSSNPRVGGSNPPRRTFAIHAESGQRAALSERPFVGATFRPNPLESARIGRDWRAVGRLHGNG
jgi:hypothetical protein